MKYETLKKAEYDYEDFYGTVFVSSECLTDILEEKICGEDAWYRVSVLLPIGSIDSCPSKRFVKHEDAMKFFMEVCAIVYGSKVGAYDISENDIWNVPSNGQLK
jgi:hypothetical protein